MQVFDSTIGRRIAATLVAGCVFLGAAGSAGGGPQPEAVSYGRMGPPVLEYLEGRVSVNGEVAEFGQTVAPGSVIQVGEASLCEIVFGERNVFRVYANTIAILEIDALNRTLDLRLGAVGAVFDKLQSIGDADSFRFATPTSVGGVRGTVFYVRVEDQNNTYVCTCNGSLALAQPDGGGEQTVTSAHHRAMRFTRSDDAIVATPSTLLYHANEEMQSIAAKVGVTIDWSRLP